MKAKLILTSLISILCSFGFAQTYVDPYVESVGDRICFITKVEVTKQNTIVSFEHLNNNGWIRLDPAIFIRTNTGKKLNYVKSEDIPLVPGQYNFAPGEQKHAFKVYFEPLPKKVKEFDLIEVESGGQYDFNFYGVNLNKKRTSDSQKPHFTERRIETEVVLTPPPPPGDMVRGFAEMYKATIDSYLNYLKQPKKLKELAQINKDYYDALIEVGFSKEQALQILISTSLFPSMNGGK
ncbi:hypothetical protein BDE36_0164 [Arcticibacter tournemirensis]|uniref:DUF4476 domain-containing protein n=1 Tax=Arcticibacter tournemirensis TaxID=699437 RepID=A0A5M9GWT3_9SPHI|nr:hypothetical protein [Arcticibacter tournemirensis]KAA8479163.1 hypothetical protein F1649_16645 [Arcticibacter tournemirensis]TQM48484.1 hypothetical protein BDE36_0164 [Arcticibacter tournemirensis]